MFKTKVFKSDFGSNKLYFNLTQLNQMSGEKVAAVEVDNDHKLCDDGEWYITIFMYRKKTNEKHSWLYREMNSFKIMIRIVKEVRLSMHFFERWTERRAEQFSYANFKKELLASHFIYKGHTSEGAEEIVYVYYNKETQCIYIMDEFRTVVKTMWSVNDYIYDKASGKRYSYSEIVEVLLAARLFFRRKNKTMPIDDYNRMRTALKSIELALVNQKVKGSVEEIDVLRDFFVG